MKPSIVRVLVIALPLAALAGACGQVTGLSDDYLYDLGEGGEAASSVDGATDAPTSDGRSDAADAADAGKCSVAQTASATTKLAQVNGAALCKTCLANFCCSGVESCSAASNCRDQLTCVLDCTTKAAGNERTSCFKNCNNGGGVPALFTMGVGQCAGQACKSECGFQ